MRSPSNFATLAANWRGASVLVIGDALLDGWLAGTPTRLSREAPVPVIALDATRECCGGAANTAANFAALGANTTLVGAVGDDDDGARLRTCVWDSGVADRLATAIGRRTVTKRRVVAEEHVLVRFDDGDTGPLAPAAAESVVHRLDEALAERPDAVVVCDYGIGTLGAAVRAVFAARRLDLPLLAVDAHDLAPWAPLGPDLVTPSWAEACRVLGGAAPMAAPEDRVGAIGAARGLLLRHTGAATVAVTLDAEGSVVMTQDGVSVQTSAAPARRSHAAGAGGAYVAGFVLARLAGADVTESAAVAQRCASMAIRGIGTAVCPPLLVRTPATAAADEKIGVPEGDPVRS
ncbi:PfkB family carbohydrate kinase [Dactylosporangium sp. AC04546]|uniref:bifunctional heptose 7-phosphate kinase/heptose 1-phosphate adenyltransferase n=1 Tax=Dactylosporangium sp. AC04546 TaxID=2862460 RepID=UPI001EDE7E04|nr:PfkB family carbohydrate kinase [Dactylosporangium sp. AC04546]WVK82763.1 PfkB family carbohydrate kinase [Dactylosporangium sp. AC04546]